MAMLNLNIATRSERKISKDAIYYIIKGVLKEATTFAERV